MNYQETSINGTSWTRCSHISISNPLNGFDELIQTTFPPGYTRDLTPKISFGEEKVVLVQENVVIKTPVPSSGLLKSFDPSATITVLDPSTGEPTGQTITHADLYVYLYSLYLQTAQERDAAQQPQQ